MARKIGDVIIALVLLSFLITGISLFITRADAVVGVNSGIRQDMFELDNNLQSVKTLETGFTDKTDITGTFIAEENVNLDERGTDAGGFTNVQSKNVFTAFFSLVGEKLPIDGSILWLVGALITVTLSILFLRMVLGETRY